MQLVSVNNWDSYFRFANSIPMLTPEEEYKFGKLVKTENNRDAAQKILLSHLRLVISIAKNYFHFGLDKEDIVQEGNVGLIKAIKRYDPEVGVRFSSYATYWIKSEINEYLINNWKIVKTATTKAQRKLFFNFGKVKELIGSNQSLSSSQVALIAAELDVPKEEVEVMQYRLLYNDYSVDEDAENTINISETLTNNNDQPDITLQNRQREFLLQNINEQLECLDERSKDIIRSRWLTDSPLTLSELSKRYDVSMERIRQIENKAIQELKNSFTISYFDNIGC